MTALLDIVATGPAAALAMLVRFARRQRQYADGIAVAGYEKPDAYGASGLSGGCLAETPCGMARFAPW